MAAVARLALRSPVRSALLSRALLILVAFALLTPVTWAQIDLEWDVNRPGQDYRNFDLFAADPRLCQDACSAEARCKAWTYVKPNTVQGPNPRCWLKHTAPAPERNGCCISGLASQAPPARTPPLRAGMEPGMNRPGQDYRNFDLPAADPGLCQNACGADSRCRAWTYVKPNTVQGPAPRCWLKDKVPAAVPSDCCVSGVGAPAPAVVTPPPVPGTVRPGGGAVSGTGGFLGCFRDEAVRDLGGPGMSAADLTAGRCVAWCRDQGFPYAGAQYGSQCFCGNTYGRYGPANNCNMPCAGDPSQACGGSWANSVFVTGVPLRPVAPPVRTVPPRNDWNPATGGGLVLDHWEVRVFDANRAGSTSFKVTGEWLAVSPTVQVFPWSGQAYGRSIAGTFTIRGVPLRISGEQWMGDFNPVIDLHATAVFESAGVPDSDQVVLDVGGECHAGRMHSPGPDDCQYGRATGTSGRQADGNVTVNVTARQSYRQPMHINRGVTPDVTFKAVGAFITRFGGARQVYQQFTVVADAKYRHESAPASRTAPLPPEAFVKPTRLTRRETPAGTFGTVPPAPPPGAAVPSVAPWADPAVRNLIDEWLRQVQRCTQAVHPGSFIDRWGRICGQLLTTSADCSVPPDHPAQGDRDQFLWAQNWCHSYYSHSLHEYVRRRLGGASAESLSQCKPELAPCN